MTDLEFIDEMSKLMGQSLNNGDREKIHKEADALLCKMLRELGYGEGVEIYELLYKWYC